MTCPLFSSSASDHNAPNILIWYDFILKFPNLSRAFGTKPTQVWRLNMVLVIVLNTHIGCINKKCRTQIALFYHLLLWIPPGMTYKTNLISNIFTCFPCFQFELINLKIMRFCFIISMYFSRNKNNGFVYTHIKQSSSNVLSCWAIFTMGVTLNCF